MSDHGDQGPPTRRAAHAVRDHVEAILIALVMALVLKQFCVEAFTIPTSSMHPTLIGQNQAPDGVGDRILVDKFANWLRDPRRWEIWVFRFPLDRSRNFIKRVVGLPGDFLKIGSEDGIETREIEPIPHCCSHDRGDDGLAAILQGVD